MSSHFPSPQAFVVVAVTLLCTGRLLADETEQAKQILDATGVKGGFIVHLGCGDGKLTAALKASDRFQVHGIDRSGDNISAAREHLQSLGIYGDVSVDRLVGDRLPYIDNLVNLLVTEDQGDVTTDEITRVLAPRGVAYVKQGGNWTKTTKPVPDEVDDWTHYLHSASGNAVAHDTLVEQPRHMQWLGSPRWSRHHDRMASMSALVSSQGVLYYIMDEGSRVSIQLPPKWTLIARDAYNGTILWKRPIPSWHSHLWPLKSGPTQLARRLVVVDGRVFVTRGLRAPLEILDATTGETLRTIENSDSTEEVIVQGDNAFLLVNKGESELTSFAPQLNTGDQGRVAREFRWNELPREIWAVDVNTGQALWKKSTKVAPLTICADGGHLLFHDGDKVVCLDRGNGEQLWQTTPAARRQRITMNFGPKLLVHNDVVLFAGGDRTMRAFSLKSGKELWTAPHAQSGYQSPEDLLVVAGMVWSAPTTRTADTGVYTGRDPRTGEIKAEFPPTVETYWFHHRCYIAKATDRFLMPSRTGIEFVDLGTQDWDIHHWVRGGCLYGVLPSNGLLYAPPHNCFCYPEAKLFGFNALAPQRRVGLEVADQTSRLEKGPAYGTSVDGKTATADDWPTYRNNASRNSYSKTDVPTNGLATKWNAKLGGRLSSTIVADGKLFVAQIDKHKMHCLDAVTGEPLWSYTTGARVDSPPAFHNGTILFGSTDGWVYCLRADDGQLVWRFRAAPIDQRLMAFEQLESVWPVHGNVLIVPPRGEEDGKDSTAYFVAGRSNFLDGGLRMYRLNARTGEMISEAPIDDKDPETGEDLQNRLRTLQMPSGLPDILSSDGKNIYMRSQVFDFNGYRTEIGPHSGDAATQGSVQAGDTMHLFSPSGYLDGTWFHRSYWVYGRSFAGGHNGYHQAGKFTPAGRILAHDDDTVFGFGRKPEYLKWTTTMEHQLFAAPKKASSSARTEGDGVLPSKKARRGGGGGDSMIRFDITKSMDPTGKPLVVEAWANPEKPNGVIVARGGPAEGFALVMQGGQPKFMIRAQNELSVIAAPQPKKRAGTGYLGRWFHLVGTLSADKKMCLYVDGNLAATGKANSLIASDPKQGLEIGGDDASAVGEYKSPFAFTGLIDEVGVYFGEVTADQVNARYDDAANTFADAKPVLLLSFDKGNAADASGNKNNGKLGGVNTIAGKFNLAAKFSGKVRGRVGGAISAVERHWVRDIPLLATAMVLTDDAVYVAGPPDLIDEEESFKRLAARDPKIAAELAAQQAALEGVQGAILLAVSKDDGSELVRVELPALPTWDGMVAANGRLYVSTADGSILCLGNRAE